MFESAFGAGAIAGALSSGVMAGINTATSAKLESLGKEGTAIGKFYGGAIKLGTAAAGKAVEYGTYAGYSLAEGGTLKDAYDNMGGLTINVANLGAILDFAGSVIARNNGTNESIFGDGRILQSLSGVGLLEVNFGSEGITTSIGTGGIDVGGALYDLAKRGIDYAALNNYAVDHSAKQAEMAWETYVYGDFTQENATARLASGRDRLELVDKDFGLDEKGRIRLGETTSSGTGGRLIQITDIGDTDTISVVLGHEAYRNGVVDGSNRQETRNAVIAHTVMADRMRADGTEFSGIVGLDLAMYDYARSMGNMAIMAAYADSLYDSSGEYWHILKGTDGEVFRVWDDGNYTHVTIEESDGTKKFMRLNDGSVSQALMDAVGGNMSKEKMGTIMENSGLKYIEGKGWQVVESGASYKRPEFSTADIYRYLGLNINAAETQAGADINSISGSHIGEPGNVIFEMINSYTQQQGLMGKAYFENRPNLYVCTSFVEDVLYIMGLSQSEYLPGDLSVKSSIDKLTGTVVRPEAGTNPDIGTYIFYKLYDDGKSGHTGFVSFDPSGKATVLHNGRDENGNLNVNTRIIDEDFNKWFSNGSKYPVIYKPITPRR
jgi:hypothetical protein